MALLGNLALLSKAASFDIEDVGGGCYRVTYKDGPRDGCEDVAAEWMGSAWSYWLTGCYNSGSDYIEIDIRRLDALREFCGMLEG